MSEREPEDFKFGDDQEKPERLQQSEMEDLRIEKLSQRVTFISVLLPFLVVVVLAMAYYYFHQQSDRFNLTGIEGVEQLTQDVDSKFSSLSIRFAQLEDQLLKSVATLQQTTDTLITDLKKKEQTLQQIQSASSSKEEVKAALAAIEQSLTPLREELKQASLEIQAFDGRFKKELSRLAATSGQTTDELDQLRTELGALASNLSNRRNRDQALQSELQSLQRQLNQKLEGVDAKFNAKFDLLQKKNLENENNTKLTRQKLDQMEKRLKRLAKRVTSKPREVVVPQPGKFFEQDIDE